MKVYVLPREDGSCRVWAEDGRKVELPPVPRGKSLLTETWVEPEKLEPLRGMKSGVKQVLCVGGPLHRIKLKRFTKLGKKQVEIVGTDPFTVPPWRGRYEYDQERDRFTWNS